MSAPATSCVVLALPSEPTPASTPADPNSQQKPIPGLGAEQVSKEEVNRA